MAALGNTFRTIERIDHACMLAVTRRRIPLLTLFLRFLTETANGVAWGIAVIILAAGIRFDFIRFPQREFVLRALIAPLFAWFVVKAMKMYWRRRRPFQAISGLERLTRSPLDDSFPSGHTASVFAFLVAMLPLGNPACAAIGAWALLISFSRLYLGVHFPSDILVGAIVGAMAGAGYGGTLDAHASGDKYANYADLAAHEREGTDFRVEAHDRKSEVLVLAIHGANIEPGSDDVADGIALTDWSEYTFRALRTENWKDLHVTSTHFDDPRALALTAKSRLCVSIHGYREATREAICLGGGNPDAVKRVRIALSRDFPDVVLNSECPSLGGTDPKNIVNRCKDKGVQLELSRKLRDHLVSAPPFLQAFTKSIRAAVRPAR